MVNQNWIEDKISKYEAERLLGNWSRKKEKQLQYLLNIYKTGRFLSVSYNQINAELNNIYTKINK